MRNLFVAAAAAAALMVTGTFTTPSEAKTITKPAGVHKVVKTVKVIKVSPRKAFARVHCGHGRWFHHGRCVWTKHNHHGR
jgi:hypothetical protein